MDQENDLVVGVGNGLVVYTIRVPQILTPGAKGEVFSMAACAGGVTANSLVQLAALEVNTRWLGLVGTDSNADLLVGALEQAGVNVSDVHQIDGETGFGFVIADASGERVGYCNQGTTARLSPGDVGTRFKETIQAARVLLVEVCQFPLASTLAAIEIASDAGTLVVLDFDSSPNEAGIPPEERNDIEEVLGQCDVVSGSCGALRDYTGLTSPKDICKYLLDYGVQLAATTMGHGGCYLATHARGCHLPAFEIDAVDTTGAGDAFRAGLVYGFMNEMELEETGMFATACGALCCTSPMNQSQATKEAVLEFIAEQSAAGKEGVQHAGK